jgi:hypothetical protein
MTFLTGITHGRPDRQRPVPVATVDERVSLDAVTNAIADVMADHNRFGIVDRALASRIARDVQTAVAGAVGSGRISSSAQLTSQQAFWGILAQHLATTSSAYMDQEAQRSLLHYIRTQANRTGPDFANFVAQFLRGGGRADRAVDRDGATLTSARFDGLSATDAALLSRMRDVAIRHGLHWAADRPEILRMGEDAIRLLARTGFTRQSHDRLHEAGFSHQDMVRIARYAERTGLDVNEVARLSADSVTIFGGNSEAERRRWLDMINAYNDAPTNAEARDTLMRELERKRREGTAEEQTQAESHLNLIQRADEALAAANTATLTASTETDAARADREAREARERAEAAERTAAEERAKQEAAEAARLAALLGEDAPTKGPAVVVQESPAKKTPAVQEGAATKEAPPTVRLTAAPGS